MFNDHHLQTPQIMPSTRPTRPKANNGGSRPHYADSDSGGDTEHEEQTPKTTYRPMARKRLSEVFHSDDAHHSAESTRIPLQSVNINDDAAEKRRRRKSAKTAIEAENAEAGPSSGGQGADNDGPRNTAQARNAQPLLTVAQAPAVNVPLDVMSSNFEEWMKMATDNVG